MRIALAQLYVALAVVVVLASSTAHGNGSAVPEATPPFAIDVTKPVRMTWPLDIGPDISVDHRDSRTCLRARQGVNELQLPGQGRAFYAFRLTKTTRCRTWFRVRYTDDGVGTIECNNSWFVGFDDREPDVVTSKGWGNEWHWERGPDVTLGEGVHWLRVELREDGVMMDRAVIVPAGRSYRASALARIAMIPSTGAAGERIPTDPQNPIRPVEFAALPTRSIDIGKGHANEITVLSSWQAAGAKEFAGTVDVRCPTVPGLKVTGSTKIACGPNEPSARNVLKLDFPANTRRRAHAVFVRVSDDKGTTIFVEKVRFVRAFTWAFLGPFTDVGKKVPLPPKADTNPSRLAARQSTGDLGLAPMVTNRDNRRHRLPRWKIVSDGSCYDWTGAVDLQKVFGRQSFRFAYAVTWIVAEERLQHRSFGFQADDAGWIWVNGQFIAKLPVNVPREANRLWSSARLSPGLNPVVIKLTQQDDPRSTIRVVQREERLRRPPGRRRLFVRARGRPVG